MVSKRCWMFLMSQRASCSCPARCLPPFSREACRMSAYILLMRSRGIASRLSARDPAPAAPCARPRRARRSARRRVPNARPGLGIERERRARGCRAARPRRTPSRRFSLLKSRAASTSRCLRSRAAIARVAMRRVLGQRAQLQLEAFAHVARAHARWAPGSARGAARSAAPRSRRPGHRGQRRSRSSSRSCLR